MELPQGELSSGADPQAAGLQAPVDQSRTVELPEQARELTEPVEAFGCPGGEVLESIPELLAREGLVDQVGAAVGPPLLGAGGDAGVAQGGEGRGLGAEALPGLTVLVLGEEADQDGDQPGVFPPGGLEDLGPGLLAEQQGAVEALAEGAGEGRFGEGAQNSSQFWFRRVISRL